MSQRFFPAACALLLCALSLADALCTLRELALDPCLGEANPLASALIAVSPALFVAAKQLVVAAGGAALALLTARGRRLGALSLSASLLAYSALVTYHLSLWRV